MRALLNALATRFFRRFVHYGSAEIVFPNHQRANFIGREPERFPHLQIQFTSYRVILRMFVQPATATGEAYMNGELLLKKGTLPEFMRFATINRAHLVSKSYWQNRFWRLGVWLRRSANRVRQARRNVEHHYDLSLAFYKLFLDADMQYSCGFFHRPTDSLDAAQRAKKHRIAQKLCLDRAGLRVLDIGSGWGGLALTLAQDYGARVDGVTLSTPQFDIATKRAKEAKLSDKVNFSLKDYRHVEGSYDRIVSVGMLEHVGLRGLNTYFSQVARLLKADGSALVHTIGHAEPDGCSNAWINKYIFPGSYIPSLSEVSRAATQARLLVTDVEIWRLHYAETLRCWRENCEKQKEAILSQFDERFFRMWCFYLAGCESYFRQGELVVYQFQLTHQVDAVPIVRDYMTPPPEHAS